MENKLKKYYMFEGIIVGLFFEDFTHYKKIIRLFDSFSNFIIETNEVDSCNNFLHIYQNKIVCSIRNKCYKVKFETSDIYVIIYAFIYSLINQHEYFGIHSVLVEKNNECVLLLGNFGAGKTTLSIELEKYGWKILSGDQTFIKFENNSIRFCFGTNVMALNGNDILIHKTGNSKKIVRHIIVIKGLAEGARSTINCFWKYEYAIRELWKYMLWPWNTLLIGQMKNYNFYLKPYSKKLECYLNTEANININTYTIRGDPSQIANLINFYLG